ncbi:MAG: patatin-like phospholipase family protein [Elusimicrobia bacterium]|nr:patatin-like phospholipase family protein [Elusimicrobiota bacterium]
MNKGAGTAEIVALLAETVLFHDFSAKELEKIALNFTKEIHPKGSILYKRGDPGNKLYIISSGQVALIGSSGSNGKETVLTVLGRGEVLGEMAVLTGEPRTVTVRLEATSEFYSLNKKMFDEMLMESPLLGVHLSRIISRRLSATTETALEVIQKRRLSEPKLILLFRLIDELSGNIFGINLGVSTLEQTRRRVCIVEPCVDPKSGILNSLGAACPEFSNLETSATALEVVRKCRVSHPSGLDILAMPSHLISGALDKNRVFGILNYLRSSYDVSFILTNPLQWESLRTVFEEVDQIYLLSPAGNQDQAGYKTKLTQIIEEAKSGTKIGQIQFVEDGHSSFTDTDNIKIGWARSITKSYERNKNVFEAMLGTPTIRAVERMARHLGNLKIGLALGSGGALGHSIIGILKVLERERIYPDIIAGTSIGSLIGAMYAKGMSVEEMEQVALSIDKHWVRETIFWDLSIPPKNGFLGGFRLQRFLRKLFNDLHFRDLEIPFTCVATDITTGEEIMLNQGRLLDAVRASIAIPVVFKPQLLDGRLLVDGGLVNPVPTTTLMGMNADVLLAVRLSNSPTERRFSADLAGQGTQTQSLGLLDIFFRTLLTMSYQIAANKIEVAHVIIHPQTPTYSWTDFDKAADLIKIGELAAEEALPKIKAQLPIFADYCTTKLKWGNSAID